LVLVVAIVGALAGAYVVDVYGLLTEVYGVDDAGVAYPDAVGGVVSPELGGVVGFCWDGFGL